MATIYNSDLSKEMVEAAKIQTSRDKIPIQLAEKVVPVMEVNPKLLRRCNIVRATTATNATSAIAYTTPSDKDFILTGFILSVVKDATATSTSSRISVTIDGASQVIGRIDGLTTTAQNQTITQTLNPPVKIDRGTNITTTNTTNVANVTSGVVIYGYLIDNSNA